MRLYLEILKGEEQLNVLDAALSAAEKAILPLLHHFSGKDVATMLREYVEVHAAAELHFIATGNGDEYDTPQVELRKQFLESKRLPVDVSSGNDT